VGQLQIRGTTLVTGGSDGSVRVWSLETNTPVHRLAAHDNSVLSLQFDDNRIMSGGSDGRVKIWDVKTGQLIRELSQPADAVWRVAFEEERSVVLASRQGRTVMEVWDFSPPEDSGASTTLSRDASEQGQAPPLLHNLSTNGDSGSQDHVPSLAQQEDSVMEDAQQAPADRLEEVDMLDTYATDTT
jgi:F-box and WD-40 domain protein CDC4